MMELRGELDLAFIDRVERATADVLRLFPAHSCTTSGT